MEEKEMIVKNPSYFDGGLLSLIGWKILGALLTSVTFGICYPFALCMIYSWQAKHTVINGRRLKFDGNGAQLFGTWLLWMLLSLITFGIFALFIPVKKEKWLVKHMHYEDAPNESVSKFTGSTFGLIGYRILATMFTICSFGIMYPFAVCIMYNWRIKNTYYDGEKMEFDGKPMQLLGTWIKWVLLSIITFGIYAWWIQIKLIKWQTKHTNKIGVSEKPFSIIKSLMVPFIIIACLLVLEIGIAIVATGTSGIKSITDNIKEKFDKSSDQIIRKDVENNNRGDVTETPVKKDNSNKSNTSTEAPLNNTNKTGETSITNNKSITVYNYSIALGTYTAHTAYYVMDEDTYEYTEYPIDLTLIIYPNNRYVLKSSNPKYYNNSTGVFTITNMDNMYNGILLEDNDFYAVTGNNIIESIAQQGFTFTYEGN